MKSKDNMPICLKPTAKSRAMSDFEASTEDMNDNSVSAPELVVRFK